MRKLLPKTREVQRRRNNEKVVVDLHWGPVKIRQDDDRITEVDLLWESPTDARPSEGRIPRVHDHFNVPEDGLGAVFFVLMQHEEHVLASYAYEDDLRNGHWNQELTQHILTCKDSPERRPKVLAQGYVDCVKPDRYYHGIDK
ncbi:hypothetical protein [Streptomyces albogriseolus]|uniref:hypothetical protein n=1 Tax=Streptomyces albogriseolus TaxID=1887 RepID=UPI0036CFC300